MQKNGQVVECAVCGTGFYVPKYDLQRRKHCSKSCLAKAAYKQAEQTCEQCGKAFTVPPSRPYRFCSWDCRVQSQRKAAPRVPDSGIPGAGEVTLRASGYAYVKLLGHPKADKSGWVPQHTAIMEHRLGRPLARTEHVHHLNGIKDDNRIENLQVISVGDHAKVTSREAARQRRTMREELAEYRRRYGPLTEE